jgi:hypothetical protein
MFLRNFGIILSAHDAELASTSSINSEYVGCLSHFIRGVWQRSTEESLHILKTQREKRVETVTQRRTLVFAPFIVRVTEINKSRRITRVGIVLHKKETGNISY